MFGQKSRKNTINASDPFKQIVTNLENKSSCLYNPNKFSTDRNVANSTSNNDNGIFSQFSK
jgi:hypothetical protein